MTKIRMASNGSLIIKKAKKIWQLGSGYQCSVLGTCLGDTELSTINSRSDVVGGHFSSSFELHNRFVGMCSVRCAASEAVQRLLMKKYRQMVLEYHRHKDECTVREMWQESIDNGDIAGAYWAISCHPNLSSAFISECYGEVHMLSHNSVRAGQRLGEKIRQLTLAKITLQEKITENTRRQQLREEKNLARIQFLEEELALQKDIQFARTVQAQVGFQPTQNISEEHERLQSENEKLAQRVAFLEEENLRHQEEKEKQDEWFAENLVQATCENCAQADTDECPGKDLCGKTVLYVGGLHKMIPHYKNLVEKNGGLFLHHDGGKEESKSRLPKMLVQADAVMCPVDCVSHDACLTVKKICKQYETPYVMMRSSGISSLIAGLGGLSLE